MANYRYSGIEDARSLEQLRDSLKVATPEGRDLRLVLGLLVEIVGHLVDAVDQIDTDVMPLREEAD